MLPVETLGQGSTVGDLARQLAFENGSKLIKQGATWNKAMLWNRNRLGKYLEEQIHSIDSSNGHHRR